MRFNIYFNVSSPSALMVNNTLYEIIWLLLALIYSSLNARLLFARWIDYVGYI